MRNLGSKKTLEVKFKNGLCAKLCLRMWFESDWYLLQSYLVTMVSKVTV